VNSPFAEAILNGSLLLAIPVALLAGLVSFLSPCVLPLVPGYLGYVTGLSGVDLQRQKRGRMLAGIGLFVLGFSLIFVLLGGYADHRLAKRLDHPTPGSPGGHHGCGVHGRLRLAAA
jgi:thiol:disulfide interchange protein